MQSVLEAAAHIALEIEKTRQRLTDLEQALQGLRPLITLEAPSDALSYSEPIPMGTVEDVSMVVPSSKKKGSVKAKTKPKAKVKAKLQAKAGPDAISDAVAEVPPETGVANTSEPAVIPSAIPATGVELWLKALGRKKLTLDQLTQAALQSLRLGNEAKATIRNRAGAWLHVAVKKSQVSADVNSAGLKVYQVVKV
jgi:hypothetical protein